MASTAIPIFPQAPITSLPLSTTTPSTTPGHPPPSPSPSPSQAQAHLYSPTKPPRTQPNAHPYAIKTTSTALLSRSTSSSTNTQSTAHHYVPSSPSPSPSMSPSPSPTSPTHSSSMNRDDRDGEYQPRATRHRYSRSLTSDMPMPLPPPPGMHSHTHPSSAASSTAYAIAPSHSTPGLANPYAYTYAQSQTANGHHSSHRWASLSGGSGAENDDDDTPRRKNRLHQHQRAETMPVPLPSLPLSDTGSASSSFGQLPEDPKTWTSEQLAIYVISDGNANSGLMAKFVREKNLSGRAFLRLAETDLDRLPHATRASLLALSRGLRHKLVRAKIFGANPNGGAPQHEGNDNADFSPNTNRDDIHAPIGSLTRQHAIRPRRRSRVDSLSGASDSSSVSSLSSDTGMGEGDTPRTSTNTNARKRVKERVDALEEKIGMMEEEGTASSSSSAVSSTPASGNGNGEEGGANGSSGAGAGKIRTKKSRMPQRGAVASLFEQGPAADSSNGAAGEENGQGNDTTLLSASTNLDGGIRDAYLDDKDNTITHVARRNVNGKEPRMLPFPPVFPSGQHPQHQHHSHQRHPHEPVPVPSHNTQPHHPQQMQFQAMSSPGPGAADSPALSDEYYGYEFGLRRAFGSAPGLGHGHPPRASASMTAVANNGSGEGEERDPHAGVYVVRHHPSSPRIVSGSGPGSGAGAPGVVSAHHTGGETARKASPRLLPYPPVVGRAVLHHPRPRRLVGVGMEMGNETAATTSDTGNEVWETALEEFGEGGGAGGREKEEEEELSVQELLLREADVASPEKKRTAPISGADAWEMEVGDTVKRVGDVNVSRKETVEVEAGGGGDIMRLFENATRADGSRGGPQADRTRVDEIEVEMTKREDAVRVREDEVKTRECDVEAKEADLKTLEEGLKVQAEDVRRKEEDIHVKEESIRVREEDVKAQEDGVRGKEDTLDARLREVEERERLVGLREEVVGRREVDVLQREEGVEKKEEEILQMEKQNEKRGIQDESIQTLLPPSTVDQAIATLTAANVDAGSQTQDSDLEPLNVNGTKGNQPSPYLISSWTVKRDWFLGRFKGIFAGARLGVVGVGGGASAGGALVLMSLGVCAVVLRVLARKVLGGAAAHAAAGGGRR